MSAHPRRPRPDEATRQAAAWFARLRAESVGSEERAEFEAWRAASPSHRAAFESFERLWSGMGRYADEPVVVNTMNETRAHMRIGTSDGAGSNRRAGRPVHWHSRRAYAVAASFLGVAMVSALFLFLWFSRSTYDTSVGERRIVALEDGSRVTLNTNTRIRIQYTDAMRIVRLERGQAYFQVAHDTQRPFEVFTDNSVVRAVGTAFDVYEHGDETVVTLVEGVVKTRMSTPAQDGEAAQPEQLVHAGQKIALIRGRRAAVLPAAVERSTAWLNGKLMFNDEPLSAAVDEANRYSTRKVKFGSASLRHLRVSGVFRAGNPAEFVQTIGGYFAIQVREDPNGDYVLFASPAAAR